MAEALEGILVINVGENAAGPQCASAFTDFGARCIHVEKMTGGGERTYLPLVDGKPGGFLWFARGQQSVTMDMKHPKAIEIMYKMVEKADVFVESAMVGAMDRLGLGYDKLHEINPRLVYISCTGFGSRGPMAHTASYDTMGQALSGRMSVTGPLGGAPLKDGNTIADFTTGFCGFAGGLVALIHAIRTGEGQHVETSLIQSMLYFNSTFDRLNDGTCIKPNGNHHTGLCPFGVFENGKGESVVICCPQPKGWEGLCRAMGREEWITDERYDTINKRAAVQTELIPIIEEWLGSFPTVADAIAVMDKEGVPNCQVLNNQQVKEHPQIIANELVVEVETPDGYSVPTYTARNTFAHLWSTPGRPRKTDYLGQSNYSVLEEFAGMSKEEVDALQEEFKTGSWKN